MGTCHACGREPEGLERIGRNEICPYCRADLHCCLNCEFYDEFAQNQCRESSAEWVGDREKNNFCEYFSFRKSGGPGARARAQEEARAKLEALFKKK